MPVHIRVKGCGAPREGRGGGRVFEEGEFLHGKRRECGGGKGMSRGAHRPAGEGSRDAREEGGGGT